jgi:hypothetical protein
MLRALGPGSVSSVLKIGLDVIHVLVWIGVGVLALTFLGALLAQPFLSGGEFVESLREDIGGGGSNVEIDDREITGEQLVSLVRSPAIPIGLAVLIVYTGGVAAILGRLRRVFQTLSRGDPFTPRTPGGSGTSASFWSAWS